MSAEISDYLALRKLLVARLYLAVVAVDRRLRAVGVAVLRETLQKQVLAFQRDCLPFCRLSAHRGVSWDQALKGTLGRRDTIG